ncbi:hypothetical protein LCGC14_1604060 [marine sediment metagenome]|uniref:Uncharacterized protein n=1 Tax=marine sediment metagenome TaxID=412755 RepID=A0A0F9IWX8_9ZZZZ
MKNSLGVMLPKLETVETWWEIGGNGSDGETRSPKINSPSLVKAVEEIKRPMTPSMFIVGEKRE